MLRFSPMALVLAGCFGSSSTPFPDGLEPLAENQASWPDGPGTIGWAEGRETTGQDRDWVHARAYIDADVAAVWAALQSPDVCEDRRRIDTIEVTWAEEPAFDVGFTTHNEVHDVVTVAWDTEWREGVVDGSAEAPEVVALRYQKVEGSDLIDVLQGSVVASPTPEGWTAVEAIREMEARTTGTEEIKGYLQDFLDEIAIFVVGGTLPTYE